MVGYFSVKTLYKNEKLREMSGWGIKQLISPRPGSAIGHPNYQLKTPLLDMHPTYTCSFIKRDTSLSACALSGFARSLVHVQSA